MLTLQQIKENPENVIKRLAVKGFDAKEPIDNVLALDDPPPQTATDQRQRRS